MRWLALAACAATILGCKADVFVGEDAAPDDAATDAADDGAPDDAPAEATCGQTKSLPACGTGCVAAPCCVTADAATCDPTCSSTVQLGCTSQAQCFNATTCCLTNIDSIDGCPPTVTGNSSGLRSRCATSCGGPGDAKVCRTSTDCGGGACVPVVIGANPSVTIGLCQ